MAKSKVFPKSVADALGALEAKVADDIITDDDNLAERLDDALGEEYEKFAKKHRMTLAEVYALSQNANGWQIVPTPHRGPVQVPIEDIKAYESEDE
jgi:hypothetical protein